MTTLLIVVCAVPWAIYYFWLKPSVELEKAYRQLPPHNGDFERLASNVEWFANGLLNRAAGTISVTSPKSSITVGMSAWERSYDFSRSGA
jgi:hypothetical protein